MIIYNFDPKTFEYKSESRATESPLEPGIYLIPAYATQVKPPKPVKDKITVWQGDKWGYIEDLTKKIYWNIETKAQISHKELKPELAELVTDKEPGSPFDIYNKEKDSWQFSKNLWMENHVKPQRNYKLQESDKYLLPDFPITEKERTEWKNYRKKLRDLPKKIDYKNEEWPLSPLEKRSKGEKKTVKKK